MPLPPLTAPPAGGLNSGVPFTPPSSILAPQDLYRVRPGSPVYSRTHVRPLPGAYGGSYFYSPDIAPTSPVAAPQMPATESGLLRLSGTPASAEVLVDGFYVGTLGDIEAQRALTLPSGPHRIELRGSGYQPATFDVRIDPTETITYRASLDRVRPQPARSSAPAAGPTKMYVIPNCYLGNIPPRADRLPKGCDIKRVHVVS